jgi:transposase InsO family protein
MTVKANWEIRRKLRVSNYAARVKNISKVCRYFGISRQTYYSWKARFEKDGEPGLVNNKPCPQNPKMRVPQEIEEKIVYLRRTYHLGPERIYLFIGRYHPEMKVSESSVYRALRRHGLNRLPRNAKRRTVLTHRYEKQVPGHHIQVDVKFLSFKSPEGKPIKRFQYTAIDDATRIRALRIYERHNQKTAIKFIDHVIEKFPFRIHTVRTDNGHEFQAQFHWHVEDLGIRHVYIKPRTPRLNGKVERSHRTDDLEFYQLLSYTDDIDLNEKLKVWENYYNFDRPHGSLNGKSPYEVLKDKLSTGQTVSSII